SIKNKNLINEKRLLPSWPLLCKVTANAQCRAFLHTLSSDFWPLAGKARFSIFYDACSKCLTGILYIHAVDIKMYFCFTMRRSVILNIFFYNYYPK
ncbi:MAG: hypothetical protein FWF85_09705, partial [Clostridiales bacterium]|nr:hypothetical protein [Clostridiales bacterium]